MKLNAIRNHESVFLYLYKIPYSLSGESKKSETVDEDYESNYFAYIDGAEEMWNVYQWTIVWWLK